MKNPVFYLMLTIVLAVGAMLYSLSSARKGRIEIVGYKAVCNDSVLMNGILQASDTFDFKQENNLVEVAFIPVYRKNK